MRDNHIAEELEAALIEAGRDVFKREALRIVAAAREDTPPTDPAPNRNPDPERPALRDTFTLTRHGNLYTINVRAPHAMKQHESLMFQHPRGGSAKFLETRAYARGAGGRFISSSENLFGDAT